VRSYDGATDLVLVRGVRALYSADPTVDVYLLH
jgi:hypothetical protein